MQVLSRFESARTPEPGQTELNTVQASVRLLAVPRQWSDDGARYSWAYCIEVQPGVGPLPMQAKRKGPGALVGGGCRRTRSGWHRAGGAR